MGTFLPLPVDVQYTDPCGTAEETSAATNVILRSVLSWTIPVLSCMPPLSPSRFFFYRLSLSFCCYQLRQRGRYCFHLVCLCTCVMMAKCVPGDSDCSGSFHWGGLVYFFRRLYVCGQILSHNRVIAVLEWVTELSRCSWDHNKGWV